jgi:hypothetical protein
MKEVRFMQNLIKEQEGETRELDSKILELQKRVTSQSILLQEQEVTLNMASKLLESANLTVSSMKETLSIPSTILQGQSNESAPCLYPILPTSPFPAPVLGWSGIAEGCNELLNVASSAQERARQKVHGAEQEADASRSMLYFIEKALQISLDVRAKLEDRMREMKELVTSRRRMPDELWVQIFTRRVIEDEDEYLASNRTGNSPFTVLRLTWVCRLWRSIIIGQAALWQYIPIPRSDMCTPKQRSRIEYYIEQVKKVPPTVYMIQEREDRHMPKFPLSNLLERIAFFKRLELYIEPDDEESDDLLTGLKPNAQEVVLINARVNVGQASPCVLSPAVLGKVDVLSCIHLQPTIDVDYEYDWDDSSKLGAIRLRTTFFDADSMVNFLHSSQASDLTIDLLPPYCIDGHGPYMDTSLPELRTVCASLTALTGIFENLVNIPNLCTIRIQLDWNTCSEHSLEEWTTFLSAHQRKEQITTFGICGFDSQVPQDQLPGLCISLISALPNISHLILEQSAVVPTLKVLPQDLPPGLTQISIASSEDVTESHLVEFIQSVRGRGNGSLAVAIQQCPSLSEQSIGRLLQLANTPVSTGTEIKVCLTAHQ